MGFLRHLRGGRWPDSTDKDETRTFPRSDNELSLSGLYVSSPIAPAEALAIGDVWSAVRCLADSASSLPVHVYRRRDDGARATGSRLGGSSSCSSAPGSP